MSLKYDQWDGSRRTGFTLVELLVVIAIIGALSVIVAPSVYRHVSDARVTSAKTQIDILSLALEMYRQDVGAFPSTDEGLSALRTPPDGVGAAWRGPYLSKPVPLDPWGRPYVYRYPGTISKSSFELLSLGRDGLEGGEDEDVDITSWGADSVPASPRQ